MNPMVSLIIPVHNKINLTLACLESINSRTPERITHEIIVVDNASTDSTAEVLSHLSEQITYLRLDTNEGFGPACNAGAKLARGEFMLFLHNDVTVMPGWLAPLYDVMAQDPMVGAVGPRLLRTDGSLASAGGLVFRDACVEYGMGDPFPRAPKYSTRRACDFVGSACMLVRGSAFRQVGGFDTSYAPIWHENADLSMAMHGRGHKTIYEPASEVIHAGAETISQAFTPEYVRYQAEHNRLMFSKKWALQLANHPEHSTEIEAEWAERDFGRMAPLSPRSPLLT